MLSSALAGFDVDAGKLCSCLALAAAPDASSAVLLACGSFPAIVLPVDSALFASPLPPSCASLLLAVWSGAPAVPSFCAGRLCAVPLGSPLPDVAGARGPKEVVV